MTKISTEWVTNTRKERPPLGTFILSLSMSECRTKTAPGTNKTTTPNKPTRLSLTGMPSSTKIRATNKQNNKSIITISDSEKTFKRKCPETTLHRSTTIKQTTTARTRRTQPHTSTRRTATRARTRTRNTRWTSILKFWQICKNWRAWIELLVW